MLINFALDCLGTVVTSDKVSADGHECSNLISGNWLSRRRGFVAEHFIKPPVNVTFEFPCRIHIYQVFVTPSVGQQLSSQVEIYSASSRSTKAQTLPNIAVNFAASKSCVPPSSNHDLPSTPPLFYQVSKMSVPDCGRICFSNPKFYSPSKPVISEDASMCPYRNTLHHFRKDILNASTHITVRLVQTKHGSSVAVSNIDIWGVPAISVSLSLRDELVAKYTNLMRPQPSIQSKKNNTKDMPISAQSSSFKVEDENQGEFQIPEEFVDPITCEVMSIPMLLPCGKNVDSSTLDQFFNSEASHGRLPRDPFTGVVFSSSSRPIPNIALKTRIDQFLMKHSAVKATSFIARTVNGKPGTGLLGKRNANGQRLIGDHLSFKAPVSKDANMKGNPPSTLSVANSVITVRQSDQRVGTSSDVKNDINTIFDINNKAAPNPSCVPSVSQVDLPSHENRLKESLSSALASLLGDSSIKPSASSCSVEKGDEQIKCTQCHEQQRKTDAVYVSMCNHVICRQCLTSSNLKITCGICGSQSNKQNFVRKHQV